MPPFVPRKRISSEDPPSAKRQNAGPIQEPVVEDSQSESSLSDAPDSDGNATKQESKTQESEDDESDEDEAVDWEDAFDHSAAGALPSTTTPFPSAVEPEDLELTLDKNEVHVADLLDGKKGPTKIERQIRIRTHCIHVQLLLAHNAVRNAWLNDATVQENLRRKTPQAIHKEIKKWRVASALDPPETKPAEPRTTKNKGRKGKQKQSAERDWGEGSSQVEPGVPDMSRGDPIISILKVLAAFWKKQFKITAPGLRKHGYQSMAQLESQIRSFYSDERDLEQHGEHFAGVDDFRSAAERMEGSRDTGAQLFTALLRTLGIEARMVASLQPLGFGWTKSETYTPKVKSDSKVVPESTETSTGAELEASDSDSTDESTSSNRKNNPQGYDHDLPFPTYWTEVASPVTHQIIPVDPLILQNPVATTPELQGAFEPRGAKAEKAKQVICYVMAYSPDKTAKDVTTRYLRRRTWPGKTKGYRIPVEKIPVPGRKGKFFEYDWSRVILRIYERPPNLRTVVDDIEDTQDLQSKQPDKKPTKEGDTLQSLRTSTEFVLERFLRREEALRPGSQPARTFTSGKGAKAKEENVYQRADVVKCLSAESWHKEGRQIKVSQAPLKRVPIRAVTLLRKREVDELERETGEKPKQGLYAKFQTEYIIPPPIRNGVIPKNDYGNIDCFVPSMIPRGAAHIPWSGTVRVCKKIGIDYAEAVTGFEFGSKMAVPVIEGVVVAAENETLVTDAWMAEEAEKRKREQLKAEKRILQTWRKFLFGLRIAERVREEYGSGTADHEEDEYNPFANRRAGPSRQQQEIPRGREEEEGEEEEEADRGGGFLLPGEDDGDDGGLVVEHHNNPEPEPKPQVGAGDDSSSIEEISPPAELESDDGK